MPMQAEQSKGHIHCDTRSRGNGDCVLAVDETGTIRFTSPNIHRVVGYTSDELVGQDLGLFVFPSTRRAVSGRSWLRWLRRTTRDGRSAKLTVQSRDGEVVPIQVTVSSLESRGLALISLEDRRPADQVLGSASELTQLVAAAMEAIVTIDQEQTIWRFNRAAEQLFGWAAGEVVGQPLDRLLPNWARARHLQHLGSFGRGAEVARLMSQRAPVTAMHRDGMEIPVEASIVKYDRGGHTLYTAIMRDVRERRRHEKELQRSRRRLADAQRIARIGNWEWDVPTGALHWSDEVYRIFGYEPGSLAPTYENFLAQAHPDDRPAVEEAVREAIEKDADYSIDHRVLRPDGRICIVHEEGEVMRDGDGRPLRMIGTVQEVTEWRMREEALARAKHEAESASRAKSEFLAAMSHELRTPLNAVIGFAEALDEGYVGPLNDKQRGYVADIHWSGRHLLSLVENILEMSKAESGKLEISEERVDVEEVVSQAINFVARRADERGVTLERETPAPGLYLHGDPQKIMQLLTNLFTNAVEFTPAGGQIRVFGERRCDGGVRLAVADTGIGMSEAEIGTALELFGQIGNDATKDNRGTGLGLPLAQRIASAHGAAMRIDSVPGQGTTVTLDFPAERTCSQ